MQVLMPKTVMDYIQHANRSSALTLGSRKRTRSHDDAQRVDRMASGTTLVVSSSQVPDQKLKARGRGNLA